MSVRGIGTSFVPRALVLVSLIALFGCIGLKLMALPDADIFDGSMPQQSEQTPAPAEAAPAAEAQDERAAASEDATAADGSDDATQQADEGSANGTASQTAEVDSSAASPSTEVRSFEGLEQIGGQPVDHPAAPALPERTAESTSSTGVGTAEASASAGNAAEEGGAATEARSFEGLEVGGKEARGQQVEVRRSIELRPVPNAGRPPASATGTPERGGAESPTGQRAPAEDGSEIPSGL